MKRVAVFAEPECLGGPLAAFMRTPKRLSMRIDDGHSAVPREKGESREISAFFSAALASGLASLDVGLSSAVCDVDVLSAILRAPCRVVRIRIHSALFLHTPEAFSSVSSALEMGISPALKSFTVMADSYSSLPFAVLVLAAIARCDFPDLRKVIVTGFRVRVSAREGPHARAARIECQNEAEARAIDIVTKNRDTLRTFVVDGATPQLALALLRCPLLRFPTDTEGFAAERARVLAFLGRGREDPGARALAAVEKFTRRDGDGAMAFRTLGFLAGRVDFFD
jgi:hypothetical protein